MELIDALRALGAADDSPLIEVLQPHWEESVQSAPRDWDLLQPEQWRNARIKTRCDEGVDEALTRATTAIAESEPLRLLAWHCHRLIFETPEYNTFSSWNLLSELLNRRQPGLGGGFMLWLSLGSVPRLYAKNDARKVPEEITRDTLYDVVIARRRFARYNDGAVGVEPRLFNWHRLVSSGDLFRIGRFEYIVRPFRNGLRAYRNRDSGVVLALSENDLAYNAEGQLARSDETPAWSTPLLETDTELRGHPISPRGFALPEPVDLKRAEWECILAPGDMVLEIHIPEGEPLTPESCRDSFERARAFFTSRGEYSLRAFACYSWLFNTQFEELLPPHSNLLAWQRECYLFPWPSTGKDGLYFMFGGDEIDPATAPRDTLLRRVIADHLQSGKELRSGAMFFCFEELSRYGTQAYREMEQQIREEQIIEKQKS